MAGEYGSSTNNCGVIVSAEDENVANKEHRFVASDSTTNSQRPYVTATYNEMPSGPTAGIVSGAVYFIKSTTTEEQHGYLDVYGAGTGPYTRLWHGLYNGNSNQRFKIEYVSNGEYTISPMHSLSDKLHADTNSRVILQTAGSGISGSNGAQQRWYIVPVATGSAGVKYQFVNKYTGKEMGAYHQDDYVYVDANVAAYSMWYINRRNNTFNTSYTSTVKNAFNNLLGSGKKTPAHYYTPSQCIDIILSYDSHITNLCNTAGFSVPKALVQALLMRELWCFNLADVAADEAVKHTIAWKELVEYWESLSPFEQFIMGYPQPPTLIREDCSTGLGQIFAETGISAHNYARDIYLLNSSFLSFDNLRHRKDMWYGLHEDNAFNIKMVYYEIFNCAHKNGEATRDFFRYSESQIKALLARYNGSDSAATTYGNEVYEYYCIFNQYNYY